LVKQLEPKCLCGRPMLFPVGRSKTNCVTTGCGIKWEQGPEGYWALGLNRILFIPIFTEPEKKLVRSRSYLKYLKHHRKVGRRC